MVAVFEPLAGCVKLDAVVVYAFRPAAPVAPGAPIGPAGPVSPVGPCGPCGPTGPVIAISNSGWWLVSLFSLLSKENEPVVPCNTNAMPLLGTVPATQP